MKEKMEEDFSHERYMLSRYIGKHIIVVTNEIENLTVGLGLEVIQFKPTSVPILKFLDIARQKECYSMGSLFAYTEQKFDGLNQLDPNTRIALFFNKESFHPVDKTKTQLEPLIAPSEWKKKILESMNLYKDLETEILKTKEAQKKTKITP